MPARGKNHGALVGWSLDSLGDTLALHIQSVDKPPPHQSDDIQSFTLIMKANQAAQLGNQLYQITGLTEPVRKRKTWLGKLLPE